MSRPDPKDLYVDDFLSNVLISYFQDADNYIADMMFPVVDVERQSGIVPVFDKDDWLADEADVRGDHSESKGSGWDVDKTTTYNCRQISHHKDLGPQAMANATNVMDLERNSSRFVAQKLLMRRDNIWLSRFFTTGVWTTEKTGTTDFVKWSAGGSTPVLDILNFLDEVAALTGFRPNVGAIDPTTWTVLREHPDVQDKIKHVQRSVATPEIMASLLEIDELKVIRSVSSTAGTTSFMASEGAMFAYATDNPSTEVPSAGYNFAWTGLLGPSAFAGRVSRIEMPWRNRTVRIEGDLAMDSVATAPDLAVFISDPL
jgi:hypothetical protein